MPTSLNDICNQFDHSAQYLVIFANAASIEAKIDCIYPESFMVAILGTGPNRVVYLLSQMNVNLQKCLVESKKMLAEKKKNSHSSIDYNHLRVSAQVIEMCKNASGICSNMGEKDISVIHIFLALLQVAPPIKALFDSEKFTPEEFLTQLSKYSSTKKMEEKAKEEKNKEKTSKSTSLSDFCTDVTQQAIDGKLDPIIARDSEIDRILTVLCRRIKNNPILLGDPGTGKTAIVEGVSQRIVSGTVPEQLKNCRIMSLNMTSLVAGTKYRGEFEKRMKQLIDSLKDNNKYILFIDEIHVLVGAGSAGSGNLDASNILKPYLARGDVKCIGATTSSDFQKYFSKDSALVRRFEQILVNEPTTDQMQQILHGIKLRMEQYHNCIISADAINASIDLCKRFMPHRNFPDKSIDCLDIACAKYAWGDKKEKPVVTMGNVAKIISEQSNIPLEVILWDNNERLVCINDALKKNIIGQDGAIESIGRILKNAYSGIRNPDRPIGIFVFGGPSGTGKTYAAKQLAKAVFGDEKSLIRLDMSEFSEPHSVSKIVGSPPGYVGFQDTRAFAEAMRRKPYSILLLDEIEKAHPDIMKLFLQVMSDGVLADASGENINFRNSIIIMTGNFDMDNNKTSSLGFGGGSENKTNDNQKKLIEFCKERYSPEFINRVDDFVVFGNFDGENLIKIAKLLLADVEERIKNRNCHLIFDDSVFSLLVKLSKEEHGKNATLFKRLITKVVEPVIADALMSIGKDSNHNEITITTEEDKFKYTIKKSNKK